MQIRCPSPQGASRPRTRQLPDTAGFLAADLSGDPSAALAKAEGGHG